MIESRFEVTIPNAQEAMVVDAKIMEKIALHYDVCTCVNYLSLLGLFDFIFRDN